MNSYFVSQHISLRVLNIKNGNIFFPVVQTSREALLCLQVTRLRTAGLSEKGNTKIKISIQSGLHDTDKEKKTEFFGGKRSRRSAVLSATNLWPENLVSNNPNHTRSFWARNDPEFYKKIKFPPCRNNSQSLHDDQPTEDFEDHYHCNFREIFLFFILLVAGTVSVCHWPMRPIKVKLKKKEEKRNYTLKKNKSRKKGDIQGKYKVLMLRGSHETKQTKNSNNEITKSQKPTNAQI